MAGRALPLMAILSAMQSEMGAQSFAPEVPAVLVEGVRVPEVPAVLDEPAVSGFAPGGSGFGPSEAPGSIENFEFINSLLSRHNEFRAKVAIGNELHGVPGPQPAAANMMEMEWDSHLANISRSAAALLLNDLNGSEIGPHALPGQNIFHDTFPPHIWNTIFTLWSDKVELFNRAYVNPFQWSSYYTNYAQLVWATTSRVGCAVQKSRIKIVYVCTYSPVGAIQGDQMYEIGMPASNCPLGTHRSRQHRGLCAESSG